MFHLFASCPAAHRVQGVSGVQRQQTGLLYHEAALCDPVGDRLLPADGVHFYNCPLGGNSPAEGQRPAYVLVQLLPKRASGGGPLAEQLQSQLGHSHGPHAVVQPARTQAALGDLEATSLSW